MDLCSASLEFDEEAFEFNGGIWTRASQPCSWKKAFKFCRSRGARLNTLDEAVEWRFGADDSSGDCQHTSTVVGLFKEGSEIQALVYEPKCDEDFPLELICEGRVRLNLADISVECWSKVRLGTRMMKFAYASHRDFILPNTDLELSVEPVSLGVSEYSNNDIVRKLMPNSAARNADVIRNRGSLIKCEYGYDKDAQKIDPSKVKSWKVGRIVFERVHLEDGVMIVVPVVLGGSKYSGVSTIYVGECGIRASGKGIVVGKDS